MSPYTTPTASRVSFASRLPAGCNSVCDEIVTGPLFVIRTEKLYKSNRMPQQINLAIKSGMRIALLMCVPQRAANDYDN
jgi:hypothetical protein